MKNVFSYLQMCSSLVNVRKSSGGEPKARDNLHFILDWVQKALGQNCGWEELSDDKFNLEKTVSLLRDYCKSIIRTCEKILAEQKRAYEGLGYQTRLIRAKLLERGLFGSSQAFGKTVFEVGLEFDPYTNAPIIPGSSIKGSARNAYELLVRDPKRVDWPPVLEMFGESSAEESRKGALIFTDAYPMSPGYAGMLLFPDVLTPHYSKAGQDRMREFGWDPIPVSYLSVAPETIFGFLIAFNKQIPSEIIDETVETAFDLGVGAKTSVGYGRFERVG